MNAIAIMPRMIDLNASLDDALDRFRAVALVAADTPARTAEELRAKCRMLARYVGRVPNERDLDEIGHAGRTLAASIIADAATLN
jgi:hypothetical protein